MTFNLPGLRRASEPNHSGRLDYEDSMFDDFFNNFYSLPTSFLSKTGMDLSPRIDISETDTEYNLEADLPGVSQKDIDVKIDNNILTVKGKKEETSTKKEKNYYMRERYYGSFQRSVSLPNNIIADNIDARFENGVLHITIPKKNQEPAKKIEVKKAKE